MKEHLIPYLIFGYLINGIIWGVICRAIVNSKGYSSDENHGFAWGFFLGLIGLIVCLGKPNIMLLNMRQNNNVSSGLNYNGRNNTLHRNMNEDKAGWVCNCGARNYENENSCHRCGKSRMPVKNNTVESAASSSSKTNDADTSARIKELKHLFDSGLITEEEFTAKKKQILGL